MNTKIAGGLGIAEWFNRVATPARMRREALAAKQQLSELQVPKYPSQEHDDFLNRQSELKSLAARMPPEDLNSLRSQMADVAYRNLGGHLDWAVPTAAGVGAAGLGAGAYAAMQPQQKRAFVLGFIKRATQYGLTEDQAKALLS